jgi:replicative DNA helicase Mcm
MNATMVKGAPYNIRLSIDESKKHCSRELNALLFLNLQVYNSEAVQDELNSIRTFKNSLEVCEEMKTMVEHRVLIDEEEQLTKKILNNIFEFKLSELSNVLRRLYFGNIKLFQLLLNDVLFKKQYARSVVIPVAKLSTNDIPELSITKLSAVNNKYEGKTIFIRAQIKRAGTVFQRVSNLTFESETGSMRVLVCQRRGESVRPKGLRKDYFIRGESIQTTNAQLICISDANQAAAVNIKLDAILEEGLCYSANVGEQVIVGGYIELSPIKNKDGCPESYAPLLVVTSMLPIRQELLEPLQNKEELFIRETIQKCNVWAAIQSQIAPAIQGHKTIKKAIALQLFTTKPRSTEGIRLRSSIHILLVGDAGVGKSQLLKSMVNMTGGIFTSAAGSTGVGLTATVVKDQKSGQWMVEAGSMVLADSKLLAIDELDKIKQTESNSIHESMEQQTVTVSKAGIYTSMNARTSVLAAANPKFGRFDSKESSLIDQITMPVTLLSRFDLIFTLTDKPNEKDDSVILSKMFQNYGRSQVCSDDVIEKTELEAMTLLQLAERTKSGSLTWSDLPRVLFKNTENLKKYARFVNDLPTPTFTDEIKITMTKFFSSLRQNKKGSIVTFRQAESLIRLVEAKCRSRGSSVVSQDDVKFCTDLMIESMKGISGESEISNIDNNILDTGIGKKQKDKLDLVYKLLKSGGPVLTVDLRKKLSTWSNQELNAALFKLQRLNLIFKNEQKNWKIIS